MGQGAEIVKRAFGILAERLWKGDQLALFEIPVRAPHHYEGGDAHGKGAKNAKERKGRRTRQATGQGHQSRKKARRGARGERQRQGLSNFTVL